jgi:hypothetical protein
MLSSEQLDELLAASLDSASRRAAVLPQLEAVVLTAQVRLGECRAAEENPAALEALLQALRVLRNACAAGPPACSRLHELGAARLLAAVVDVVGGGAAALNWQLPAVAAQLLANAVSGSPGLAAAAWAELFPTRLLPLSHVASVGTQAALALALLTCIRTVPGAAAALASPPGGPLLSALLHGQQRLQGQQESNDTLGLLCCYLCLELDRLEPTFAALGAQEGGAPAGGGGRQATAAQVLLLQELSAEAQHAPNASIGSGGSNCPAGAMRWLLGLVEQLATGFSDLSNSPAEPAEAALQALQDGLQLLRDLAARDDGGAALAGRDLLAELLDAGAAPALLAMLRALGPVRNPRRPAPPAQSGAEEFAGVAVALRGRAEAFPGEPPYSGYRSDILAGKH